MDDRPAFLSTKHPSSGALSATLGGGVALLAPSSPLHLHDTSRGGSSQLPLNLCTYTAGEDAGRLAMLAKELGLQRTRAPKPQLRKHAFKPFLRARPETFDEDTPQEIPHADSVESLPSIKRHPPLRFVFSGYSLWLELEQREIDEDGQGDLDRAMIDAADRFRLGGAIPSPHVTALYGINTIEDEGEVRSTFREHVREVLEEEAAKRNGDGKLWPDLDATGIIVGTEFDGVDGGTMDMAWAEVSLATSPEHERILNALYELFYRRPADEEKKDEFIPRSGPWVPHLSLCYDNPEGYGPVLSRSSIEEFMREQCPTLKTVLDGGDGGVKFTRPVTAISLWRTAGTMDQWQCLDRFEFPSAA